MSNFFDIKRFGNYLLCEADRARSNYMWSAIVCVLSPALVFAIEQSVSVLFSGHFSTELGSVFAILTFLGVLFVTTITFPNKMYGNITEKRWGSDFLMLPASTFEKWLSIVLMTCVVAPVVIFGLFFLCDWLLSVCFGNYYGDALLANAGKLQREIFSSTSGALNVNLSAYGFIEWCCSVLTFTLGAIVFKTGKIGKTILAVMAVSFVFGIIMTAVMFVGVDIFNPDPAISAAQMESILNSSSWIVSVLGYLWYLLVFCVLGGGIYYRLRTLAH